MVNLFLKIKLVQGVKLLLLKVGMLFLKLQKYYPNQITENHNFQIKNITGNGILPE